MENLSTALSNVGKLSPQIRLAQAISEFGALFADDAAKHAQFKNLRNKSPPTGGEVVQLTEEINNDGSRRHKSWKPFATRLILVLERVQQFAPVGDVLTGGAQSMLASGVWASIRMALEISLGFLSYFDKVSNLLLRIGRCVSLHQDFALLFPQCSQIQGFMCEYTIVIVQICKEIVVYARKSFANQLASSFLSPFDTVFKPLEEQLLGWGRLIEKRTQIMATKSSLERESTSIERYNRLQVFFTKQADKARSVDKDTWKHRFLQDLSPDQREFDSIWRRERRRGTSQWILKHPRYEEWLKSSDPALLWLQGNLGSGKSVTMASIVASLVMPNSKPSSANTAKQKHRALRTVSFFFCTKATDKTLKQGNIMGSLACQTLRHEAIIPSLVTFLDKSPQPVDAFALMDYVDLLLAITPRNWQGVFILDGLDEVPIEELKELFVDLRRLLKGRNVLLCCSARSNTIYKPTVHAIVPVKSIIAMEAEDRLADFEAYISTEIERWKIIRSLSSEIEQLIIKQLLVGCQGMFLWLALQVEAICSRHTQELRSDSSILSILDNLPRSLPEAFDQALLRISDVRYDEIRVAVNIEPGNLHWTPSTILGSGDSLAFQYGGSLLEIDEEDLCVRVIHHSVLLHLAKPPALPAAAPFHFELSDAEVDLAVACVTYLSYGICENQLSKTQNIALTDVPSRVQNSMLNLNSVTRKAWSILSRSGRRKGSANVNVERLLQELRFYESKAWDEIYLLLPYVTKHWLGLTKSLPKPLPPTVYVLWTRLVDGITGSTLEVLPWTPRSVASATTWAICNRHKPLLRHQLCSPCESKMREAADSTMSILRERSTITGREHVEITWSPDPLMCLSGEDLGNLAPVYLRSAYTRQDLLATDVAILVSIGCLPWASESSYDYFDDPISAEADLDNVAQEIIRKILLPTPGPLYVRCAVFLAHYLKDINQVFANGLTLLEEFITGRKLGAARVLLEKMNADPNGPRRSGIPSSLQLCLRHKNYDLAARLIDRGADVMDDPDDGLPPFLVIIREQNMSLFDRTKTRYWKHRDRRYGKDQETAFQFACADPNEARQDATLPLYVATGGDVQKLLEAGACADPSNAHGITPLMVASFCADRIAVEALIGAGASVQSRIHMVKSPNHKAWAILSRCYTYEEGFGMLPPDSAKKD
ncbi:NACHT domain-containing protein [Colletotrichum plurivorum]|uniref:NACHT domain-containing protein n=1 Tax=Colletotrichum plurivorum TaxID=2175906 RepID=A0A8H6KAW5_9PEZI|nr:NACHT domain-containing protein [Colletotrichum plurivorum]